MKKILLAVSLALGLSGCAALQNIGTAISLGTASVANPVTPTRLYQLENTVTVVFAGLDDPVAEPADYRRAASMFSGEYVVEEVPGGHFMHREHPDVFAERLLTHL